VAGFFLVALLIAQVGIESQGAVMPALLEKMFGDFTMATEMTIFASILGFFGRMLAPKAIARWGLKKTFLGATALRVLSVGSLALLLHFQMMSVPFLFAFAASNGFLAGIAITAETSIPPEIVGQNPERLESFWAWEQFLLEIIGIAGPIATTALLGSLGYLNVMLIFPISFAIMIGILAFTLNIPKKVAAMDRADLAKAAAPKRQGIGHGARVVWGNPVLKYSFLAYAAFMMLNPFLYGILASAYGMRMAPGQETLSAGIYGLITGLYSFGGLIAGVLLIREGRRLKREMEPVEGSGRKPISTEEVRERLRRSMLRYMRWGTLGLALIGTLAFPSPLLSSLVSLPGFLSWLGPLSLPALALIPFGVVQVASMLKLRSFFQSEAPREDMPDSMAFMGAVSLAVSTLGLLGLKFLFKGISLFGVSLFPSFTGLTGFAPFMVVALAMIPLAAASVYLTRRLDRASAPPGPVESPRPKALQ